MVGVAIADTEAAAPTSRRSRAVVRNAIAMLKSRLQSAPQSASSLVDLRADPRLMARRSAVNVFLLRIGRDPAPQT
jgi:hypothetical protein